MKRLAADKFVLLRRVRPHQNCRTTGMRRALHIGNRIAHQPDPLARRTVQLP